MLRTPRADKFHPINRGLVAWWPLHETTENYSHNALGPAQQLDLTLTGYSGRTTRAFQGPRSALTFNGSSQYAGGRVITELAGAVQATMSAWLYRSATSEFVGFGVAFQRPYSFRCVWYNNGNLYIPIENGGNSFPAFANSQTGWHHLAVVFDGSLTGLSRLTAYWDGVAQSMTAGGVDPPTALPSLANLTAPSIGSDDDGSGRRYWGGAIADVRAWKRAVPLSEINAIRNNPWLGLARGSARRLYYFVRPAGSTNITLIKQPWIWAGTSAPVNAKQMLAATKQPWVWSPQVLSVNAKTMFAAVSRTWVWSPGIPPVNAKAMLQATKATWVWSGNPVNFTNGTGITLVLQAWIWAGTALNVNAKTMISAVSQAWIWAGTAAAVNAKTAGTTVKAPWVWAGQAATVTAQTSLTLVKQAWVWAGNVPGVTYIQHASVVGVSWIWRGIRLRGSRPSSQGVVGGVLSGILRGVMQLPSRWKK